VQWPLELALESPLGRGLCRPFRLVLCSIEHLFCPSSLANNKFVASVSTLRRLASKSWSPSGPNCGRQWSSCASVASWRARLGPSGKWAALEVEVEVQVEGQ